MIYLSGASTPGLRAILPHRQLGLMWTPAAYTDSQHVVGAVYACDNGCFIDAVFIGGDTDWKLSAHTARLAYQGKERGKWVHMGRVNSRKRLQRAAVMGCDSADGTFLKFAPDTNLPRLLGWLRELDLTPVLDLNDPAQPTRRTAA